MYNNKITWKDFHDAIGCSNEILLEKIILPSLCIGDSTSKQEDEKDEIKRGLSKGRLSEFIKGERKKKSNDILQKLTNAAMDFFSGNRFTYKTFPYLLKSQEIWQSFLDEYPDNTPKLKKLLAALYERIYDQNMECSFSYQNEKVDLIGALKDIEFTNIECIEDETLLYQLSVFSIIASTWPIWELSAETTIDKASAEKRSTKLSEVEMYRSHLKTLANLIFPRNLSASEDELSTDPDNSISCNTEQLCKRALHLYESEDYISAGELLVDIIVNHLTAPHDLLATAYAYLIKCCEYGYDKPKFLGTVDDLKKWAAYHGSTRIETRTHRIRQHAQKSTTTTSGFYYINCKNTKIYDWIKSTVPDSWDEFDSPAEISTSLALDKDFRFIYIKDDYELNVHEVLILLDKFKTAIDKNNLNPAEWGRIEIVIRCEQELATPLLDTAFSFLYEKSDEGASIWASNPIRLYLLDEKKRAVDLLFAKHCLFYPLTKKSHQNKGNFNLVILSDNEDLDYTSWLIREAFWLLPHLSTKIPSKITVLSPYATEISDKVTTLCPGFSAFTQINETPYASPVEIEIDDIPFAEIEYHNISMDSFALTTKINNFISNNDILYYVIDSSHDFKAISYARKIREISIRKMVHSNTIQNYTPDSTVIAVRCLNPDYAGLTEDLIVPKESERENRWFNDYKLFSFGSIKDLYSWDELTGGTIEFISECMHLQYCNGEGDDYDFSQKPPAAALWSYYNRLYNRDSSYAAALSLPYRLFEAGIFPEPWYYDDIWRKENRNQLADAYDEKINNDFDLQSLLCEWEHMRWCCYLLSIGWLPATPSQVRTYMNNGVSRHSLQIAKLHPCLCSWDSLTNLYRTLNKAYIVKKDAYDHVTYNEKFLAFSDEDNIEYFQTLDVNSILQTGNVLRAEPYFHLHKD